MDLSVDSEIGRLQQVILHRPGSEMLRLTPQNKEHLLFDDVLWLERAPPSRCALWLKGCPGRT